MKKVLIVLLSLLLLCGCSSDHTSHLSDGETVLFETPDGKTYTKEQSYTDAKNYDLTDTLTNLLTKEIAKLEDIDLEPFKEEAQEYVKQAQDEGYEYYLEYYYGGIDEYIESHIITSALNSLKAKYVALDLESFAEDYAPFKAEMVSFDDEETAKNVVEAAKKGEKTFAFICSASGYEGEISETIYTNYTENLKNEVRDYVKTAKTGISDVIAVDNVKTDSEGNSTTTTTYYVLNLITNDVNDFAEEFEESIASDILTDNVINYYLSVYPIEVHDQTIFDTLSSKYEAVK